MRIIGITEADAALRLRLTPGTFDLIGFAFNDLSKTPDLHLEFPNLEGERPSLRFVISPTGGFNDSIVLDPPIPRHYIPQAAVVLNDLVYSHQSWERVALMLIREIVRIKIEPSLEKRDEARITVTLGTTFDVTGTCPIADLAGFCKLEK